MEASARQKESPTPLLVDALEIGEVSSAAQQRRPDTGGVDWQAVWSLTSMSLGVGMFSIPSCFAKLGLVQGAFWVILYGMMADFGLVALLDLAGRHGVMDYEALAKKAFGASGSFVMSVVTLLTTSIATLAYIGAAKDLFERLSVSFLLGVDVNTVGVGVRVLSGAQNVTALVLLLCVALPFCAGQTMDSSAWISRMGVFALISSALYYTGFCVFLLLRGCGADARCSAEPPPLIGGALVGGSVQSDLVMMAQLAFSYSAVFALFPVLEDRVRVGGSGVSIKIAAARMKSAVRASVALCCVIYLIIGLIGASALGEAALSVSLNNLSLHWASTQCVCLLMAVSITLLVAVVSFPSLRTMEYFLSACVPKAQLERSRPALLVAFGVLDVFVCTFLRTKEAFALTGSLGLALAGYVVPSLLCLRLNSQRSDASMDEGTDQGRRSAAKQMVSIVVLGFGLLLLFGCTPATLFEMRQSDSAAVPIYLRDVVKFTYHLR